MAIKLSHKLQVTSHKLKDKRILITAGPTWVPIDSVRVISNIATGRTGILLAERLKKLGAKVTLLLGAVPNVEFLRSVSSGSRRRTRAITTFGIETRCLDKKIKVIRFNFFDDLKNIIKRELKNKRYDIVIHSAAVSDYRPKIYSRHKIKSGIRRWKLNLVPTPKLINLIKEINPSVFLVGFKFEPRVRKKVLIDKTKSLINRADLDLAVANTIDKDKYEAYIINRDKTYGPLKNKSALVEQLINTIGDKL